MNSQPPSSVLVLKPSSFGDIIHTLPAVARLKAAWPSARITWLINTGWVPLLEANPDIAAILPFPRAEFRGWRGWRRFHRWQRQHICTLQPDLTLDFQGLLRSAWIGHQSRPRSFLGLADAREGATWFYDRVAPLPAGVPHSVERYLALARFAIRGQPDSPQHSSVDDPPVRFHLPAGDPLDANIVPRLERDFILLNPYSRGAGKSLNDEQIAAFCRDLAPRQVVLVGAPAAPVDLPPLPNVLDLLGNTTMGQLIWIMRRAAFVISVDSGPVHLAAALAKPLVAIHTWSDPRRVGPYRPGAWIWKNSRLVQVRDLQAQAPGFFEARTTFLTPLQIAAICELATSP